MMKVGGVVFQVSCIQMAASVKAHLESDEDKEGFIRKLQESETEQQVEDCFTEYINKMKV